LISRGSAELDSALIAKKNFLKSFGVRFQLPRRVDFIIKPLVWAEKADRKCVKIGRRVLDTMGVYFVVDTLKYLHKGGRIGGASAFLGSALDLKPILYLSQEGKIEALEKVRTKKKAVSRLVDLAVEKAGGENMWCYACNAMKASIKELERMDWPRSRYLKSARSWAHMLDLERLVSRSIQQHID
jgi:hypothetical protein